MTPAVDDSNPAVQSSAPLLSRRRGSLSNSSSSSSKNEPDLEQGVMLAEEPISVRVKTAGDGREYNVSITLTTTVAQFKAEVSRVVGAEGKYLRLICAGKMLNPDEAAVKEFGLTENCYVHCVITAAPPRLQLPSLTPEQVAEEEVEDDDPATRRGFDALRNNGMTRGEVTAIRSYFSAQVREFAATLPPPSSSDREDQTDWDRQVESEDLWMRAQPPTSEFALNVSMARRATGAGGSLSGALDGFDDGGSGGTRDFMFGFAMGAFLGVIMLLWLWEAAVPRRQKLGILAGVTFKQTVQMVQAAAGRREEEEGEDP
ncbi:unnamed protein product [Scytosiphon promiscuus]